MTDLKASAQSLRELHRPGEPLLLPNAWDVASARAIAAAGAKVIATSSAAVAGSLGLGDHDNMPADVAFEAVARIAQAVELPVTADLEAGYQLPAEEFIRRLLAAGAVGCNIEDTDHHGTAGLVPVGDQAAKLAAIREAAEAAGVGIVLNARVDSFLQNREKPGDGFDDGVARGRAYLAAGADCVYPIFLADDALIGRYVQAIGGPVNVLSRPGAPSVARLAELGVARISVGGGLFHRAMTAVREGAAALLAG